MWQKVVKTFNYKTTLDDSLNYVWFLCFLSFSSRKKYLRLSTVSFLPRGVFESLMLWSETSKIGENVKMVITLSINIFKSSLDLNCIFTKEIWSYSGFDKIIQKFTIFLEKCQFEENLTRNLNRQTPQW